jgi:hypothetical protein
MAKKQSHNTVKPVRSINPKSLKNLKPFKPGADPRRNAGGVPQDTRELNALLDEIFLEEITDEKMKKMSKLRFALNRMLLGRNIAGAIHLMERRYGKIPQAIDLSNTDGSLKPDALSDDERIAKMKELATAIAEEINKHA